MANKAVKTELHAFKKIGNEIRTDSLRNPLFFYGREQYLIQWAIASIKEKMIHSAAEELDFSRIISADASLDSIINQCETLPVLSARRVVVLEDFALLAGKKIKGFSDEDENCFAEYIKNLPDSCILILTEITADKRRKLYKTVLSCGACYEFNELDPGTLRSFIAKRFKQCGKHAKMSVINELISNTGYYDKDSDYTLYNLENDIKKAAAHSDGDEIDIIDIKNSVSGNTETNVFEMIDALSKNKKDEAFLLLHNLLSSGENEYKLLSLICSQFEAILMVKEMKEEGYNYPEIQTALNIHEVRIKKAAVFANRYSVKQLRNALIFAFQVDKNIKYGLLDSRLALEMLIASI